MFDPGLGEAWKRVFSMVAIPGVVLCLCRKDHDG